MTEFAGKIGHLTDVESPWGNAGGVVKTIEDVEKIALTGVGWIEAGSYTLEPRMGNSPNGERVYYHDTETGLTYNSLGMPNKGLDSVEKEIPEMVRLAEAHHKKLVVNVAPVSEHPAEEAQELVARAYAAGAPAVLLNAGCPNVVTEDGGRHEVLSHDAAAFSLVLRGLRRVAERYSPLFVRISPQNDLYAAGEIAWAIRQSQCVSAVFDPNTWGGSRPPSEKPQLEVPGGVGGKSGPGMAQEARSQTRWISRFLRSIGVDTVSSSSIMNASELKQRLQWEGAVAGAGTTFFYESADWQYDVDKLLTELATSGNW